MISSIQLKEKLHNYIDVASASKLKAIYTLIENEIEVKYSIEDIEELNKRRKNHLSGKSKAYSMEESFELIYKSK